ncbi:MAG: hypothetical protein IH587_05645 [Anaerolineae bacterium]|nr:hypothetical protein [Anaerolineae bacterium]
MAKLLSIVNLLGQTIAAHPIFIAEARRSGWARTARSFRRASTRTFVLTVIVAVFAWGAISLLAALSQRADPWLRANLDEYQIYVIMLIASFLGGLWLDFHSLSASINAVSGEISTGRWDLLRLTALNDSGLIAAKHAASQLRVWRGLIGIVGIRLGLSVIGAIIILRDATGLSVRNMGGSAIGVVVSGLLVTFLLALLYLLEPFWRVRAVTAFGVYVSVRERNTTSALLSAIFGLFALWLAQAILLGSVSMGLIFAVVPLLFGFTAVGTSYVFSLFCNGLFIILFISAVYGFHHLVERWSLRQARRRLKLLN